MPRTDQGTREAELITMTIVAVVVVIVSQESKLIVEA